MNQPTTVTWEEIYNCWKSYVWTGPSILKAPIVFEEINIDYKGRGIFYGYDWLTHTQIQNRKEIIKKDATQFMYFTEQSNKGTIHTLRMLADAKSDEEIAAIWIYAIAFEISQNHLCGKSGRYVHQICIAAQNFLSKHLFFWHHAMRKLVPEIYIDYRILEETEFKSIESIVELIALNVALIKHEFVPVLYSSLENGKRWEDYYVRLEIED